MRRFWIGFVILLAFALGFFWSPFSKTVLSQTSETLSSRSSDEEEAPQQPIAFSHVIHAKTNQIPCQYCHVYARRSPVAGVPSVERCIACHRLIDLTSPELEKLKGYWDRKESIPWVKVNDLPDFVRFSHKRHIAREITCERCHGPVETMEQVRKGPIQKMPDCVQCHRAEKAPVDCWTCHK